MAEINWTREAEQWMQDIYDYIAQDNPEAAKRVVEGIYATVQLLQQFPRMGYKFQPKPEHNIRIIVHGHYRIAYLCKPDNTVDILGVFHRALDITRYLF